MGKINDRYGERGVIIDRIPVIGFMLATGNIPDDFRRQEQEEIALYISRLHICPNLNFANQFDEYENSGRKK